MFYDLNVAWTTNVVELQRTTSFLADLGYSVIALNHTITGKLPNDLVCPIPNPLPFEVPAGLRILRRCTIVLMDPSQNHRLATLAAQYDILAIRPGTEKALQLATQSQEADLISIDLTQRYPFHMRPKMFTPALQRGLRLELSYGTGASNSMARRYLISNATALIRATRGRSILLSSEAKRALDCRGPYDVMNLATVWGLKPERSREAISVDAKAVVAAAEMRRTSYKGVVEIMNKGQVATAGVQTSQARSLREAQDKHRKSIQGTSGSSEKDAAHDAETLPDPSAKPSAPTEAAEKMEDQPRPAKRARLRSR